jgi:ABC-type phosphate transport system permease subunit
MSTIQSIANPITSNMATNTTDDKKKKQQQMMLMVGTALVLVTLSVLAVKYVRE